MIWNWFLHVIGVLPKSPGEVYNFWSGFGSDIGEFALLGAIWAGVRHMNCHRHGCWRVGRYPVEGTPYKVCKRCHPAVPDKVTHEHIREAHRGHHKQGTCNRSR